MLHLDPCAFRALADILQGCPVTFQSEAAAVPPGTHSGDITGIGPTRVTGIIDRNHRRVERALINAATGCKAGVGQGQRSSKVEIKRNLAECFPAPSRQDCCWWQPVKPLEAMQHGPQRFAQVAPIGSSAKRRATWPSCLVPSNCHS
jgi:hypothetical protein